MLRAAQKRLPGPLRGRKETRLKGGLPGRTVMKQPQIENAERVAASPCVYAAYKALYSQKRTCLHSGKLLKLVDKNQAPCQ